MSQLPVTIYTPDSALRQPGRLLRDMVRDLGSSGNLAWRLAVRDIHAQYRQALLGILWAFILPLANTLTWVFLNGTGVVAVGATRLPYVAYAATGAILWAIFMDAINAPLQQTNAARGMLAKLNFPREALIVSGIYQTLFNAGIKLVVLVAVLIGIGVHPDLGVLLVPLGIVSLVLVGTALGLLVTPIGLLYTDVGRALPLLMQFLMFVTPVVFPMPTSGWAAAVFAWNPLTPLILTSRDWLTGAAPAHLAHFGLVNAAALVALGLLWVLYRLAMPIVIERMST